MPASRAAIVTGASSGIALAIAQAVRFLLNRSPNCVIPKIVFQRPGKAL
jgi:NADP-dependent 3-hydroxy acid dehydrogenase YdfG